MFTLFKKTISSVVADLEQKVVHLEQLAKEHTASYEAHVKAVYDLEVKKLEQSQLAAKAERIAAKVKALIE